ncbi:MAG: fibronectin type III domain-containing protein (plasmid) [Candidatus Manganitrophus sp.]|nr:MAG: fibronectin type III domain-containing protein [Candidatus Manganitrophus sp.]WDT82908.1 MAG: fibronectin type III domain-containing protein [Candidatus Manganitrophus sp.]
MFWKIRLFLFFLMSIPLIACGSGGGGDTKDSGEGSGENRSLPSAPVGVVVTAGDGKASVSWNFVDGADSYNLYMASASHVTKLTYATSADGVKNTSVNSPFTMTGLTNGKTYYFVITAVNAAGEGPESSEVAAIPVPGISSDVNDHGVLDKVETYIKSLPITSSQKDLVFAYAGALEKIATTGIPPEQTLALSQKLFSQVRCLDSQLPAGQGLEITKNTLAETLQDESRSIAYLAFEAQNGGEYFALPPGDECEQTQSKLSKGFAPQAASEGSPKIAVVYINGVNNTRLQAYEGLLALEKLISRRDLDFGLLWNPTAGIKGDLLQSAIQKIRNDPELLDKGTISKMWKCLMGTSDPESFFVREWWRFSEKIYLSRSSTRRLKLTNYF